MGGSGNLTKNTGGTVTLSGNNTYSGTTTLNAGTLIVNGTHSGTGTTTVNSGARLKGTGSLAGTTTVSSGATVEGGNSIGTLGFENLTLTGGGNYNWQIDNATGTAGTNWDQLNVSGTLDITATSSDKFNINVWTLLANGQNGELANFNPTESLYTWVIITAGSITGFSVDKFQINTDPSNGTGGLISPYQVDGFTVIQQGNDIVLKYDPPSIQTIDGTNNGTEIANYTTSNTTGSLTLDLGFFADYLIVGGGGGGGGVNGGGGGAGGFLEGIKLVEPLNHQVIIGQGGQGGQGFPNGVNEHGSKGGNSSVFGQTAIGGGGGSSFSTQDNNKGVGGSGAGRSLNGLGFYGVDGQGFNGGTGISRTSPFTAEGGGGGGGAGGPGSPATATNANGGPGRSSTITGSSIFYAGGGGGGFDTRGADRKGTGGQGGGGNGTYGTATAGNGTNGFGGGGGGGGYNAGSSNQIGGSGGSGVVIIRYEGDALSNVGGTVTTFTGNGTIGLNGVPYQVHTFTSSGNFDLSQVDFNARLKATLSGNIVGNGDLIYDSQGRLTLTGTNNTYTGTTTIQNGELRVNSDITSSSGVTVASTATLSGTGTLPATVVNGTHSPGNSPGLQTFSGNLTYNANASLNWELASNSVGTRGTDYDAINVTGNLDFAGSTTLNLIFNGDGSSVDWNNNFWDNPALDTNGWKLFEVTGTISNLSNLNINVIDWVDGQNIAISAARAGYTITFDLHQDGSDVYITYDIQAQNADLSNLVIDPNGPLSPAFDPSTLSYTNPVSNATTSVDVTATLDDANASLTINGQPATSGSPTTINIGGGQNIITIEVTAADGIATKTYTVDVSVPVDATETVISFKNTGTTNWTAPPGVHKVQVLVVGGGGGGGGRDVGGGGGAGGLVFNPDFAVTPGTSYTVTVGAGGVGGVDAANNRHGKRGGNSVFGSITAQGGGGGNGWDSPNNTNSGGSGGGGAGLTTTNNGNNNTAGQGNIGGIGNGSAPNYGGGGGGGAGQTGFASSASPRGKGGDGLSAITIGGITYNFMNLFGTTHGGQVSGSNLYFAGGGGGAGHRSSGPMHSGPGGLGGGGTVPGTTGVATPAGNGEAGLANTGGGGSASRNAGPSGGAGGSGVVIIRYSVLEVGQNGPDQLFADTETSGFVGLLKVDTNTVEMTGNSNFSGVSVSGGTLLMGDNGTSGTFGTINPRVAANTFFGINRSDDITYDNLIIGQGGFVHRGDGKTTFTERQTYTGGTIVDNGTLVVAAGTSSGGTGGIVGDVTVNQGGNLEYAGIRSFGYGNGESVTSLTINGGSVGSNFYNYFWNASSTFPINMNGGTLVLGGDATGTTANQFLSPIITVGAGSPSQINRADGNTTANLRLRNGTHLTVDALAGSKLFVNVPVTSASGSTDGPASGQLIKNGTGTLVLNSANLYTGATTINEGTLEVNGSINSAITMSASGIIAGNGTLNTVSLRGTVSPGSDGTGTLTTGNVTLAGNTAYVLDLDNADDVNGVPGTDWDLLQVNGTLALGSHEVIIELQGSPGDFSFLQEYSWKIVSANSISGFNANNWTVNTVGFSAFTGNALWTVEQVGNEVFLKFEPKSIVWPGVGELNSVDLTEVNDNITIDAGKTLTVEIGAPVDYLVVAGGGSGAGRDVGGGGGAGGVLSNLTQPNPSFIYLAAGTYNVSVGAGGIGTNDNDGVNGQNSIFGPFTAIGGGGGGYFASYTAPLGGSGGGGGRQGYFGGPGVNGQGFAGGNGSNGSTVAYDAGGGGGGAGGPGETAIKGTSSTQGKGGDGGPGIQIDFTGTPTYYGGGGGGAPHRNSSLSTMISGLGGIGGGGNAAVNNSSPPQAGQPNTGGGGGASRSITGNLIIGGNGGSGIVQVRYPAPAFAAGGNTIAGSGAANGYTIHSFTQTGTATFTIPEDGLKTTYLGLLDGPGNFEFDSPGTLVIGSNQSFTGTSTILQGNLEVNANLTSSSSLVVETTATLSGTGTLPETEVFGAHNPGSEVGVQTITGDLTYKTGSIINWELFANVIAARGVDFDGIDVTGNLSFEANTTLNLLFNSNGSAVDWNDPFWNISRYEADGWKLFSVTGSVTGLNNVTLPTANLLDVNGVALNSVYPNIIGFELKQVGDDVYLSFVSSTVWYGNDDDDWSTNTNWLSNRLPIAGEGLIMDGNAQEDLVLDQSYQVADIKFAGANKKIVLDGHNLTFTGLISGADASNYIQTNGTGKLISSIPANGTVRFEVGRSA